MKCNTCGHDWEPRAFDYNGQTDLPDEREWYYDLWQCPDCLECSADVSAPSTYDDETGWFTRTLTGERFREYPEEEEAGR